MTHRTSSKDETQQLGVDLAKKVKSGGIICLYGDMGSGKTTLTQGLAKGLGVTQNIVSPTFILMRRYNLPDRFLYHIDLYRLNDFAEVKGLGIAEILENKDNVVVIEWPEKIEALLPQHIKVNLKSLSESERELEIIY